MSTDASRMTDAFSIALEKAANLTDPGPIVGYGVVELRGPDGNLKEAIPFANKITNYGDQYYAKMAVSGVSPATPSAPTLVQHMKLGTGTTAVDKAAATNEVVETYISGSMIDFDATYPQTAAVGGNNQGWNATYKTTWGAGTATNSAITEATITSSAVDGQGAAGDTIARVTFTAVNKGANDTLAITWSHKFLGS